MKTIRNFALIFTILFFAANSSYAQDQKSEGNYV